MHPKCIPCLLFGNYKTATEDSAVVCALFSSFGSHTIDSEIRLKMFCCAWWRQPITKTNLARIKFAIVCLTSSLSDTLYVWHLICLTSGLSIICLSVCVSVIWPPLTALEVYKHTSPQISGNPPEVPCVHVTARAVPSPGNTHIERAVQISEGCSGKNVCLLRMNS